MQKLAAYLDEAGDTPNICCETLLSQQIRYVAIRNIYRSNILYVKDDICNDIRKMLDNNNITPIMLSTDLNILSNIHKGLLDKTINLSNYFKTRYISFQMNNCETIDSVENMMDDITDRSISANIVPLLEMSENQIKIDDIIKLFKKYRRWKILYDPARFIIRRSVNPFMEYWQKIKDYVGCVDLHDYKTGHGHKPPGFGDCRISETISDADKFGFTGWYLFEPSIGRIHGKTKSQVFNDAFASMKTIIGD